MVNGKKYLNVMKGEGDWARGRWISMEVRWKVVCWGYERWWEKGKVVIIRSKTGQPSEKNTNLDHAYQRSPMRIGEPPMGITYAGVLTSFADLTAMRELISVSRR
ncbi:hypothetical protein HAX54_040372 [Datura stramonium]|uniref:Uncharacterized protein n=1 Tax=Datura stramonium TaxID=4076 RepID=A0ABS8VS85_DATST|nr:hypothetical protein [Datura stramonium]